MIDDRKIEEAKKAFIADKKILGVVAINDLACGFKEGAKWAINEFLKGLWHPASEEPKTFKRLIAKCHSDRVKYEDTMFLGTVSWNKKVKNQGIINWLYIDDLFPKEGGE
jgi:hypothetical protein